MPTQSITRELVIQIETIARRFDAPRVARLHVPAPLDQTEARPRDAAFCALELDDGAFGLSYVALGNTLDNLLRSYGSERPLAGVPALDLARNFASADPLERALALAAINALTDSVWRQIGFVPPVARNSLGDVQLSNNSHLGMIGFFPPLVRQVQACGARLTVVELDQDMVRRQQARFPDVRVTLDRGALAECDLVVGTSTMLLNGTLDDMLAAAPLAKSFSVIGPSAGLWPDALFARGVSLIGGTRVVDAAQFRAAMASAAPWSGAAQKFALTRSQWPGWRKLLV